MKRYNIIPLLLLIYLVFMAYIGRGMYQQGDHLQYFGIIGISLVIIISLRFVLKRKEKLRDQRREELKNARKDREE